MPGIEYIPKLKEVEGVGGDSLTPSNMARRPLTIRLENMQIVQIVGAFLKLLLLYFWFNRNANRDRSKTETSQKHSKHRADSKLDKLHCTTDTKALKCIWTKKPIWIPHKLKNANNFPIGSAAAWKVQVEIILLLNLWWNFLVKSDDIKTFWKISTAATHNHDFEYWELKWLNKLTSSKMRKLTR